MAKIHPGATLTPHFRDFLPQWLARQPWYLGQGAVPLVPVGYFRFEDPAGAVGVETHLISVDEVIYQVPMTYRDAPLDNSSASGPQRGVAALIATAEHSVLGTRWIYDAVHDPVWVTELLRVVRTEGDSEPSRKRAMPPARARGHRLTAETTDDPIIELNRVITPGPCPDGAGVLGVVMGTWYPGGADTSPVEGCLAVVRDRRAPRPSVPA